MPRAKRRTKSVPPAVNCLLLCDDVLISQGKQKHFLQGIIGAIGVPQLPAVLGGYVAYVRLSGIHGEQKIKIGFENAGGGDPLFEIEAGFSSQNNPLGVYTLVIPVPPFAIREAGRYIFVVRHAGVPIAQSPIQVLVAQSPEDK